MKRSWLGLLLSLFVLLLAGCGGEDSITSEDLDRAVQRWADNEPGAYQWRADGFVNDRRVGIDLVIVEGVAESDSGGESDGGGGSSEAFTPDGLFSEMQDALNEGTSVKGSFDDETGYPTRVLVGDHINLTTREFIPIERPEGCAAEPGSATDLASEPAAWLLYANYHRWSDVGGCEVRVDVISQITGPEHCGWESATFITIGTPIGAPHSTSGAPADGARTYIWDPEGALLYIDGIERDLSLPVEELPDSVMDTEFRDGDAELWLDSADRTVLYRVDGDVADRYVVDEPRRILCA